MELPSDLYRTCLDAMSEAVLIVDVNSFHIVDANLKALKTTGYLSEELHELDVGHLFCHDDISKLIQNYKKGETRDFKDISLTSKTGEELILSVSAITMECGLSQYLVITVKAQTFSYLNSRSDDSIWLEMKDFPNIIGKSERIRDVCRLVGAVAKTDATVLIQGESGTGKEVIANAIHIHSLRREKPFVKVNCAALSESLLESELFGHVKGAFTGAIRDRNGRFKQADGGTILLDEIGSMSLSGQAKLLRVLQEHKFEPVGSSVTIPVNVRVIASTNTDLAQAVSERQFREDLFYRLNVFTISLPPLRTRKEDIFLLTQHFLDQHNRVLGKDIQSIDPQTLATLVEHDWPGNVRELENVIEHAAIVEKGKSILPSSLPSNISKANTENHEVKALVMREKLLLLERQILLETLQRSENIKKNAAVMLGIDPRNLPYLLRKHHLD
jgi:two-component system, NtrC family, response regulator AtoC